MAEPALRTHFHKIHVFSDDGSLIDQVLNALSVVSTYEVKVHSTGDFIENPVASQSSDLVILDIDDGKLLEATSLHDARRMMNATTPLVVVSRGLTTDKLRDVIRLNVADSLYKPIDRHDLLDTTIKILKKNEAAGRVIAFVSAAGGSGASILAMNAAYLAARRGPRHACMLVDLDFTTGSCGYFLDIRNDYDFRDVLDNPSRIDTEFIDIIRKEHPVGFSLFSVKAPILLTHSAGSEIILRILDVLTFQYATVIVDVPYYHTAWQSAVLEAVSDVVIVTECLIPALKQARDLDLALRGARPQGNVTIVANKFRRSLLSNKLSKKEVTRVFDGRQVEFLPEAPDLVGEAANQGLIPVEHSPRSSYSRAVGKFMAPFLP